MNHEIVFRSAVTVLVIVLYVIRVMYWKKNTRTRAINSPRETFAAIAAPLWALSLLAYIFHIAWLDRSIPIPQWLRWLGIVLLAFCIPLASWTYQTLGVHFSAKLQLLENHALLVQRVIMMVCVAPNTKYYSVYGPMERRLGIFLFFFASKKN
jgi:protein-S-isoprenylcysteine O-methyltransferase Ste14